MILGSPCILLADSLEFSSYKILSLAKLIAFVFQKMKSILWSSHMRTVSGGDLNEYKRKLYSLCLKEIRVYLSYLESSLEVGSPGRMWWLIEDVGEAGFFCFCSVTFSMLVPHPCFTCSQPHLLPGRWKWGQGKEGRGRLQQDVSSHTQGGHLAGQSHVTLSPIPARRAGNLVF